MKNEKDFEWKPLIADLDEVPAFAFLAGDVGEKVDTEVKKRYKQPVIQNATSYRDGIVKGSNPFYVVAANEVLGEQGSRVATPAELEIVLQAGASFRGTYEDTGLVLRTEEDPNKYLAKDVARQVKKRDYKFSEETPLMIPLVGLRLRVEGDSPYGLAFELAKEAELIEAPQLSNENYRKRFSKTNSKGLPEFDENGTRVNYTAQGGLRRFYLGRSEDLYSYDDDLGVSVDVGRVVVVRAEGASRKILHSKIKELEAEREKQIAEVEGRYQTALKFLRGEKI